MSDIGKPKQKKHLLLGILVLLVILLVIAVIVLSLLPGSRPGRSLFDDVINRRVPTVTVNEFYFEVGRNRVFAHAGGSVASAGTLGFQVLGSDGRETLRDSYRAETPALVENNGRFLAFDIGGTAVRLFNSGRILSSFETEGSIVSASVNSNGWFCVVKQEQFSGSKGTISVYNSSGGQVFQVTMGTGFALSARLCNDNRNLAILNLAPTGSRLTLYRGIDRNKDEPDHIYELGNSVFIDFDYLSNSRVIVWGTQSLMTIDLGEDGAATQFYNFDEKRLGNYSHTERFIALHLYDFNIGYSGQIITLDFDGTVLGQLDTSLEITSISSYAGTLTLLHNEGISFYSERLDEYPLSDSSRDAISAGRVLALNESTALTANDLSAIVVRRG